MPFPHPRWQLFSIFTFLPFLPFLPCWSSQPFRESTAFWIAILGSVLILEFVCIAKLRDAYGNPREQDRDMYYYDCAEGRKDNAKFFTIMLILCDVCALSLQCIR
jgi:hypothetical protein